MAVSTYNNNNCRYRLDKLDKVVYLISEDASKHIFIDNGEAYVTDIEQEPLTLKVYNIALTDTDELDERYKFTHQLTFSMDGYVNYKDFQGRYFAIVKSLDGVYWLVNPLFPCKVTYTYTLDANGSHTDFTMSTASNHPTLRIRNISHATPYDCGYKHCTFSDLKLNESIYSLKTNNHVLYTNDGFKDVIFTKNSGVFTEQFDGVNIQHSLAFNINFDDYKSSWHYNLLEFSDNVYAAVIETSCGKYITCGFGFGLQPSFNVTANDDNSINNIQIQLIDVHDNGDFIEYTDSVSIEKDGTTNWTYTNKYNGYECIGNNLARYLLMEEVDALLNPTGNYKVLVGYENQFSFLNIVGTFTDTVTFNSYNCADTCKMQSSFPLEFVFNTISCREYSVICDSDWSISSTANYITVSPSNGIASQSYTVQVCNTILPQETEATSLLNVNYCNKTTTYNVRVKTSDSCLTAGAVFDISANGQYVTIPTSCCVNDVNDIGGTLTNITIQTTYIKVYVPQNNSGAARQFVLSVTYCDGKGGEIIINQGTGFERWVKESTACTDNKKCDVERKYTGTTITDIDTPTEETRYANCEESLECSTIVTRWVDSSETTCSGGKKYIVQVEQKSTDGGQSWSNTGNKRLGGETQDSPAECEGIITYEDWRIEGYMCEDTTKYQSERLYTSTDNVNWIATNTYRRTDTIIEQNSEDCGYVHPSDTWTCEKWELDDGYTCEGTTKYAREQRFVRDCQDCNNCSNEWIATGVYRRTSTVLEENSEDCGYVKPSTAWTCSEWRVVENEYICEDGTKYTKERQYVRDCEDCNSCSTPWDGTDVYRRGSTVLETNSPDCGYDPSIVGNCTEYRNDGDTICNGYDKYQYLRKYVRDCQDCSNCEAAWTATSIYKQGSLIQSNSVDCGYIPSSTYERWEIEGYTCDGYSKYEKKRKYISEDNVQWYQTNIYETGNLIEEESVDCGFIPSESYYEWRTDGTMCNGFDKYYQERKYISYDGTNWISTDIKRQGAIIEINSVDCGYVPPVVYEYRWVSTTIAKCVGTTKYYQYKKQRRKENTQDSWEDVVPTVYSIDADGTEEPIIAEQDSPDCGYVPPVEPIYRWVTMDINRYWICADCDDTPDEMPKIEYRLNTEDSTVQSAACDSNTTLSSSDYGNQDIVYAKIGGCITSIGNDAFKGKTNLAEVLIPSTVTTIGSGAFSGCTSLIDFSLPMSVTSIGTNAFNGCIQLNKIMLPNSLTNIGNAAFRGCKNFPTINIPQGISIIPTECFYDCDGITDIYLPNTVRLIQSKAFGLCEGLVNFTCYATEPPAIYQDTFQGVNEDFKIYVPSASVDTYKLAWSNYANNIVAIEN